MIKMSFTPQTALELAKMQSKVLVVMMVVLFTFCLIAVLVLMPLSEKGFVADSSTILLLLLTFLINEVILLAGAYAFYKLFIYLKIDYNSSIEIEIGEDYVIKHLNGNRLHLINQVGLWRNERRSIKEPLNQKISFSDLSRTEITKKGIKFYTSGVNGITVSSVLPDYHAAVHFVKVNGEKVKLVK